MSICWVKRFRLSPEKRKLLILICMLAALTVWFQLVVVRPGFDSHEMLVGEVENHGVVVISNSSTSSSSFDASVGNAGFDEDASFRMRPTMSGENDSVVLTPRLGELYNLGLELQAESMEIERFVRRKRGRTVTISEMNSMLIKAHASSHLVKRRLSAPERELLAAKTRIKIAHSRPSEMGVISELHPSLFRNVLLFQRSYKLMEQTLKIYIYKEGERPVFHQPKLRGLYCAEGWFMQLLERSKRFVVKDPRKAHLFYLPFSSELLRLTVYQQDKSPSLKKLEMYLMNYVDLVRKKYNFWNRTGGVDHFFVGCHDWAPRITGQQMSSCIRAFCNANVARGFNIGKDVSIPVTYIRSGNNPLQDIGGNPPSQRPVLAFFAGGIPGYLRPILLQHWGNKTTDMKIFGPMQRDSEGKAVYRRYMKESKYCICARGYEVHTPRVVESIYYECVPVIISDNYVPPFFEVLDWEAFSVVILEKDIPFLREILLSIPEDRYLEMQRRVSVVRRHFIWNKIPEKYDLFHMILHSIWFNRVSQI